MVAARFKPKRTMKNSMKNAMKGGVVALALGGILAACGGGGDDEAGSLTALSVQPTTVTTTASNAYPAGACAGGWSQKVFVYGGAAPYRINNTMPDEFDLDTTQVSDRGGAFVVTAKTLATVTVPDPSTPGATLDLPVGACVAPALLVIVDKNDKQVVFTINNKPTGG